VYGKKVVSHYHTCCDCLIIDSRVHIIAVSKPDPDGSGKLGERSNAISFSASSRIIDPYGKANANSDTIFNATGNIYSHTDVKTITNIANAQLSTIYGPIRWKQELERISRSVVL